MLKLTFGFIASTLVPSALAYIFTIGPERPIPNSRLFYDIQSTGDEPSVVDILLFNQDLGNETAILRNMDLTKTDDAKNSFFLPFCPPGKYALRLLEPPFRGRLQDSPPFEIFAIGSPPPSPSPSAPNAMPTPTPAPTAAAPPLPIGPIAAGAAGGLGLILVIVALVYFCKRRTNRLSKTAPREKHIPPSSEFLSMNGQPLALFNSSHGTMRKNTDPALSNPGNLSLDTAPRSQWGTNHGHVYGVGRGINAASSSAYSLHAQDQPLSPTAASSRRTLTRNNTLTSSSAWSEPNSSSTSGLIHSYTQREGEFEDNDELAAQVAALRNHVRQLEVRQTHATYGGSIVGVADLEPPPPSYDSRDPSPAIGSRTQWLVLNADPQPLSSSFSSP